MSILDPELIAMSKIDNALKGLSEEKQRRVLAWLVSRYCGGNYMLGMAGTEPEKTAAAEESTP